MALVIGPSGAGKTLLLKRLGVSGKQKEQVNEHKFPVSVPTVGTNLINIDCGRKSEVVVRELGGAMAPIWKNYFQDCKAVLVSTQYSISKVLLSIDRHMAAYPYGP